MISPEFLISKDISASSPTCQGPLNAEGDELPANSNIADSTLIWIVERLLEEKSILCPITSQMIRPGLVITETFVEKLDCGAAIIEVSVIDSPLKSHSNSPVKPTVPLL